MWKALLPFLAVLMMGAASAPPQQVASPEQTAAQQQAAESLSNIAATYREQAERAERSKDGDPCEKGDDKRYSDLCAQWKAADSAALSAWLGWISFVGVIFALGLNAHSNWIASSTARQQLRAYLTIKHCGYAGVNNDAEYATYTMAFTNSGQTPAYDYRGWTDAYIAPQDHVPEQVPLTTLRDLTPDIFGAGQVMGPHSAPLKSTPAERADKIAQTHLVFVVSAAEYRDTFGRYYRFETAHKSLTTHTVALTPVYIREQRIRGPHWRWWHLWNRHPD